MKQFEVYRIVLDPTVDAEIRKARPAVIISPDSLNRNLKTVIIAPLTTTIKGYPSRVSTNFKNKRGDIALDQMRAVDKSRLISKLGFVDVQTRIKIKAVIQAMFS